MRLGTWNCQTGLSRNWDVIDRLDVDLVTVQECGPETEAEALERGAWSPAWQRGRYRKGLALLARHPFSISSVERSEPCFISAIITMPDGSPVRFVGLWAMTPTSPDDTYPRQAARMIEGLVRDGLPTFVAGDFNASWRNANHLRNATALRGLGLVNAYNTHHRIEDDARPADPTSFFRWQESSPYHMDFVYVPADWPIEAVDVGSFAEYPARRLSDHVPVVVTLHRPDHGASSL